ncbi:MAG TPA: MFS transporter [Hyphomicrobiales bacterium]|nr:MFS transporter [Hyphomicrobiales bacterium]
MGRFTALRSAFSSRNYAIYISGNCLSLVGFWMQRLAVAWLAWELSHSEFWVGVVAFADLFPLLIIGPVFGVWADRFDRKRLAMVLQSLMLVQAAVLYLCIRSGMLTVEWLFVLTLIEGTIHASYQPVRLALIPNLVRREDVVTATAFTAVTFNVARFVGPAIAGVVIALYGAEWAVIFNVFSYALIVATWNLISLPPKEPNPAEQKSVLGDMCDGFRYILERPALSAMFTLFTIIALFARPLTFMLPAFVGAVYEAGPETLALFTSSVGAGAVLAGLKLSVSGKAEGLIRSILINSLITVVLLIGFSITKDRVIATVLIFGFGYSLTSCTVASQTLVQNRIDDLMRGRVLSLWVAFTRGAPALGVLVIGWFSDFYGLQWPNVVAALMCLFGVAYLLGKRRQMRRYFEQNLEETRSRG